MLPLLGTAGVSKGVVLLAFLSLGSLVGPVQVRFTSLHLASPRFTFLHPSSPLFLSAHPFSSTHFHSPRLLRWAVQPINAELAVEVAYPADENAIEALQQLYGNLLSPLTLTLTLTIALTLAITLTIGLTRCGNLFSALLVPIAERAAEVDLSLPVGDGTTVRGDSVLLGFIALVALGFFTTFDGQLKRSALDGAVAETDAEAEAEAGHLEQVARAD